MNQEGVLSGKRHRYNESIFRAPPSTNKTRYINPGTAFCDAQKPQRRQGTMRATFSFVFLCLSVAIMAIGIEGDQSLKTKEISHALRKMKRMSESRTGLRALGRALSDIDSDLQQTSDVTNLSRKRQAMLIIKRLLREMDADLINEQKRTCALNLGGHCATESAASVADQWHYLNSALSPGRKRRDTRLFKRLIGGQLPL